MSDDELSGNTGGERAAEAHRRNLRRDTYMNYSSLYGDALDAALDAIDRADTLRQRDEPMEGERNGN